MINYSQSYIVESNTKTDNFFWQKAISFFFYRKITIGRVTNFIDKQTKSILFFIKIEGRAAKKNGDIVTKKMTGLQIIKTGNNRKVGFINRSKTIKKIG